MPSPTSLESSSPLDLTATDLTQTRAPYPTTLHMRWPVDEDTTRRLTLLTHDRIPLRRRVIRWLRRKVIRRVVGK